MGSVCSMFFWSRGGTFWICSLREANPDMSIDKLVRILISRSCNLANVGCSARNHANCNGDFFRDVGDLQVEMCLKSLY